jgi:hypothetical protein
MHKKLVIVVLSLALISGAAFASGPGGLSGIGVFGSFGGSTTGSTGGGVGLSLKFGSFPVLGIQYDLSGNGRLALACDYYVIDAQGLAGPLSFYLGVGAFGGLSFGTPASFDLGLRIPVGLQLWPVSKLEIFLAGVPIVRFIPTVTLGIGGEVGLRVHF